MNLIIKIGSTVGALGVIVGAWIALGFPIPATSADIQRLDSQQLRTAVDVYRQDKRDAIIARSLAKDPAVQRMLDEDLVEARQKLKDAQRRLIELPK